MHERDREFPHTSGRNFPSLTAGKSDVENTRGEGELIKYLGCRWTPPLTPKCHSLTVMPGKTIGRGGRNKSGPENIGIKLGKTSAFVLFKIRNDEELIHDGDGKNGDAFGITGGNFSIRMHMHWRSINRTETNLYEREK